MFVSTFLPINLNLICNLIIPEQKQTTCQVFFLKRKGLCGSFEHKKHHIYVIKYQNWRVSVLFQTDPPPVALEEHPPTLCCDCCAGQGSADDRNSSVTEVAVEVDGHRGLN